MNVKQEEVFELKQEELIKDEYISDPELRLGSTFSAMPTEKVTDCNYQSETTSTITNNLKFKINCQQEYFCSHCDFKTINKGFLNGHKLMHSSKLFHQCTQCDFKGDLILHMLTHSDNKRYHCKQCYFKASRKDTLQLHMLMHGGVKPVHSERCDFKTSRKYLLKKHMYSNRSSPLKKICSTDRFNEDTKDRKEFPLDLEIVPEECVVFNSMDFIIKKEPNDSDL